MNIRVGHLIYAVLPLPIAQANAENIVGLHDGDVPAVYIRPDQPPPEQVRILWHELIHALFHAHGISARRRDEEQTCLALESGLTMLALDNPRLPAVIAAAFRGKPIVKPPKA